MAFNPEPLFKGSTLASLRLGHGSDHPTAFRFKKIHVGQTIKPYIDGLRETSGGMAPSPRTAGNLLLTFHRLGKLGAIASRDGDIGPASITAEHVDGLTIVSILHADNRFDHRAGVVNQVSFVGITTDNDAYDTLNATFKASQTSPTEFVEALRDHMSDEDLPAHLRIAKYFVYNEASRNYNLTREV